jgi:glycosyltransferase involved in cell wall biosynthesis
LRIVLFSVYFGEYTIQLANALSDIAEVTLMLPEKTGKNYSSFIRRGIKTHFFHSPRLRYPSNLWVSFKVIREINKISPDVVHIQEAHPWFNTMLPFLRQEIALVTTIHDVNIHLGDRDSHLLPLTRIILLKKSSRIIVHGEYIKKSLSERYGIKQEKIEVIPHGALSLYKEFITKKTPEEKYTVLFFGRIWEYKGLRYLIEAEPLIAQSIPELKIIVAGRGDNLKKYEDIMVHKEKFIIYNHYISDEKVAELFQQAAVVVLPYVEASQSGVIPIAYSFGKPVVATKVGSIPEVVEDGITGLLVPPSDHEKLAQAIIKILGDENLRKGMGENAFKMAQGKLAWSTIANQTLRAYQKAIAYKT